MTEFTLTNIIGDKGENVTIHFYITGGHVDDRHSFTMQSQYKMNHDLAGGDNRTFSFKTGTVGGFYQLLYIQSAQYDWALRSPSMICWRVKVII